MGQVVVVWCLVCAVTFLCSFVFSIVFHIVCLFSFSSKTSDTWRRPLRFIFRAARRLLLSFLRQRTVRLNVPRACVCMHVLHCFLQHKRDGGMLPHVCHAKTDPPSSRPRLFCAPSNVGRHARRFLCAGTLRRALSRTHLGGGGGGFKVGHVVGRPLCVARRFAVERLDRAQWTQAQLPSTPSQLSRNPTHIEAFRTWYNPPLPPNFAQAFHFPPSFTQNDQFIMRIHWPASCVALRLSVFLFVLLLRSRKQFEALCSRATNGASRWCCILVVRCRWQLWTGTTTQCKTVPIDQFHFQKWKLVQVKGTGRLPALCALSANMNGNTSCELK